jgi:hypothetical protein
LHLAYRYHKEAFHSSVRVIDILFYIA